MEVDVSKLFKVTIVPEKSCFVFVENHVYFKITRFLGQRLIQQDFLGGGGAERTAKHTEPSAGQHRTTE
jgi:hypothetical protein